MPVRRIPPSRRAITGRLAAHKSIGAAHYESSLERDFLITLEVDIDVLSYETQPIRLNYLDQKGHKRHYTPDVLVNRRGCTELCEVKYASDVQALRQQHKERWLVAHHYSKEQGWKFRLITEHHARHPRSRNWLFLSPYRTQFCEADQLAVLKEAVKGKAVLSVREWLSLLPKPSERWIGYIWHLLATGQVITDLKIPLGLDTMLYIASLASFEESND